jgi:uncharacterized protein YuzE
MSDRITVSVDTNHGAAYIQLTDEPIAETVEATPSVQVDIDATGTVVGVELLSIVIDLPVEALSAFQFPSSIDARMLSHIWGKFSYSSSVGQGQAYVSPVLQIA